MNTPATLATIAPEQYDRRKYIGGSSIAGILGLQPPKWRTAVQIWERMTREEEDEPEPPREQRRRLARGHVVEPLVDRMLEVLHGITGATRGNRYVDPDVPYFAASIADAQPGVRDQLQAMVDDPNTSLSQMRAAIGQIRQQNAQQDKVKMAYQVEGLDKQAVQIERQLRDLRRFMQAAGFDPEVSAPAALNPQVAGQGVTRGLGLLGNLKDAYLPGAGGNLVSGGRPELLAAATQYARLKNQLAGLVQQRQSVVNGLGTTTPTTAPAVAPQQMDDDTLKKQLAAKLAAALSQ